MGPVLYGSPVYAGRLIKDVIRVLYVFMHAMVCLVLADIPVEMFSADPR